MKAYVNIFFLFVICRFSAAGCMQKEETGDIQVYYLNTEGTALATESYSWKSDQISERIEEVLKRLRKPKDTVKCTSAIPADVLVTDYQIEGNRLDLYFSQEYELLNKSEEVLLRAAVVESMTQIDEVYLIQFYVKGKPLENNHGEAVGYMRKDDFVQNTGTALNSYQQENVTLYFADSSGSGLVKTEVALRYNSYMTLEKAIVEQLIKGPETEGRLAVIPAETKLLSVLIKDDICYVNLNEGFLAKTSFASPELAVYSLVNSIIEGGNCSQVQISINGDPDVKLEGEFALDKPFEKNMKIVEG